MPLALAIGAFAALQFTETPFPVVVLVAGIAGVAIAKFKPDALSSGHDDHAAPKAETPGASQTSGALKRIILITAIFAVALIGPSLLAISVLGAEPFSDVIKLFTTAAFVTFGGAYAVLPFVADAAVKHIRMVDWC